MSVLFNSAQSLTPVNSIKGACWSLVNTTGTLCNRHEADVLQDLHLPHRYIDIAAIVDCVSSYEYPQVRVASGKMGGNNLNA